VKNVHACIGSQNINAPKLLQGLLHTTVEARLIGDVRCNGDPYHSTLSDTVRCRIHRNLVVIQGDNKSALACKGNSNGPSNALPLRR